MYNTSQIYFQINNAFAYNINFAVMLSYFRNNLVYVYFPCCIFLTHHTDRDGIANGPQVLIERDRDILFFGQCSNKLTLALSVLHRQLATALAWLAPLLYCDLMRFFFHSFNLSHILFCDRYMYIDRGLYRSCICQPRKIRFCWEIIFRAVPTIWAKAQLYRALGHFTFF